MALGIATSICYIHGLNPSPTQLVPLAKPQRKDTAVLSILVTFGAVIPYSRPSWSDEPQEDTTEFI